MAACIALIAPDKVRVDRDGVAAFNSRWPCSELRTSRAYWFEFDSEGNLVDTDVPESDDGGAASAMADDCGRYLSAGIAPDWAPRADIGDDVRRLCADVTRDGMSWEEVAQACEAGGRVTLAALVREVLAFGQ